MKKTMMMLAAIGMACGFGCGDGDTAKKLESGTSSAPVAVAQKAFSKNIADYTKFKVGEKVQITPDTKLEPGTIEAITWDYVQSMIAGDYKKASNYMKPENVPNAESNSKRFVKRQFELKKTQFLAIEKSQKGFRCTYYGYSNEKKSEKYIYNFIVIRDGKVLIGYENDKTFED